MKWSSSSSSWEEEADAAKKLLIPPAQWPGLGSGLLASSGEGLWEVRREWEGSREPHAAPSPLSSALWASFLHLINNRIKVPNLLFFAFSQFSMLLCPQSSAVKATDEFLLLALVSSNLKAFLAGAAYKSVVSALSDTSRSHKLYINNPCSSVSPAAFSASKQTQDPCPRGWMALKSQCALCLAGQFPRILFLPRFSVIHLNMLLYLVSSWPFRTQTSGQEHIDTTEWFMGLWTVHCIAVAMGQGGKRRNFPLVLE